MQTLTKTAETQGTPTGLYKNGQAWLMLMLHCLDIYNFPPCSAVQVDIWCHAVTVIFFFVRKWGDNMAATHKVLSSVCNN